MIAAMPESIKPLNVRQGDALTAAMRVLFSVFFVACTVGVLFSISHELLDLMSGRGYSEFEIDEALELAIPAALAGGLLYVTFSLWRNPRPKVGTLSSRWTPMLMALVAPAVCVALLRWYQTSPAEPPPPGLTDKQAKAWESLRKIPDYKRIEIFEFDPTTLNSTAMTLNVRGKAYTLQGRTVSYRTGNSMRPGRSYVSWSGRSADGEADLNYDEDRGVSGWVTLNGVGSFLVGSVDGLVLLAERRYKWELAPVATGDLVAPSEMGVWEWVKWKWRI